MKIIKMISYISIVLLCVSLVSCNDVMQEMIDDYNKGFIPTTADDVKPKPKPGDEDFDPSIMLADIYTVRIDGTLSIPAPDNCSSYEWIIYSVEKTEYEGKTVLERVALPGLNVNGNVFCLNVSETTLTTGVTYKIVLKIVYDGIEYEDSSRLIVWKDPQWTV